MSSMNVTLVERAGASFSVCVGTASDVGAKHLMTQVETDIPSNKILCKQELKLKI